MKVSLISGTELSDDVERAWMALQQANPDLASPYFHPEFTKIISSVRHDVEVAIVESEGQIAALFPFQRGYGAIGRPVGDVISDYQGIICAQDFRLAPSDLLGHCRLVAWDFDHLITSQSSFAPFQWSVEASPQIDISNGYDAYIQERRSAGSEQIKKIYNLMRRIEREVGPLRFVAKSSDAVSLGKVLAWKSEQYRRSDKCDLFTSGWIREAVNHIFATQVDGCSGVLSLLFAGDRLVAGHFGMQSRRRWHYWFPAYGLEAAKYSPGLILLLKMAEHAPKIGVPIIDLGKGTSLYKERLMNASVLVASGSVELPSWLSVKRSAERNLRSLLANSPLREPMRRMINSLRRFRASTH